MTRATPHALADRLARALAAHGNAGKQNPDLDELIWDEPEADEGYIAYGKWLQRRGDRLGAIILSEGRIEAAKKRRQRAIIPKHDLVWLEDLAASLHERVSDVLTAMPLFPRPSPELGRTLRSVSMTNDHFLHTRATKWFGRLGKATGLDVFDFHLGFPRTAIVTSEARSAVKLLEALVRRPAARFLRVLELSADEHQPLVDVIVRLGLRLRALRELVLGGIDSDAAATCDLEPAYPTLARLRSLNLSPRACGGMRLGTIDLPELRSFKLTSGDGKLTKGHLRAIATARWPKLHRLQLGMAHMGRGLGNTAKAAAITQLEPVFAASGLPSIRWLGLNEAHFSDALPGALAGSRVLKQLVVLELRELGDVGARALVRHASAFAHLKALDVRMHSMSDGLQRKVEQAPPT